MLGLETVQQAWEAYRDVECQTIARRWRRDWEATQLACEIRPTRSRTDGILRLGAPGG